MNKNMDTSEEEPFPWHLGVYDAHCHPTDTMAIIDKIQEMKARILTVMATRIEDQELVISTADKYGVKSSDASKWKREECIVPCFGWHPWFSHQMYIDDEESHAQAKEPKANLQGDAKIRHYQNVLQPSPFEPLDEENRTLLLSLPDPISFSDFLARTRQNLEQHPYALIGEIGLDRSFRIPVAWDSDFWSTRNSSLTPGGREGRKLTPFKPNQQHQKKIFKKQLQLAAEMGRAVSVHGVQAHGLVFETLSELWKGHEKEVLSKRERKKRGQDHPSVQEEMDSGDSGGGAGGAGGAGGEKEKQTPKPYPLRICLHSYSGNPSNFKQYLNPAIPMRIYASFSTAINLSDAMDEETPRAFAEMVRTVPDDSLLVESDLHTAGEEMDRRLEDIVRRICKVKGWGLNEGVEKLGRNWKTFVFSET